MLEAKGFLFAPTSSCLLSVLLVGSLGGWVADEGLHTPRLGGLVVWRWGRSVADVGLQKPSLAIACSALGGFVHD